MEGVLEGAWALGEVIEMVVGVLGEIVCEEGVGVCGGAEALLEGAGVVVAESFEGGGSWVGGGEEVFAECVPDLEECAGVTRQHRV